jgi:hypothetical protein
MNNPVRKTLWVAKMAPSVDRDPYFAGAYRGDKRRRFPSWISVLIYSHCAAAVLTAMPLLLSETAGIRDVAIVRLSDRVAGFAFLSAVVFPPIVLFSGMFKRVPARELGEAIFLTIFLSAIQFCAILPMVM